MRTADEIHALVSPLLQTAQEQGINSGTVADHIDHALAFAGAWSSFCGDAPRVAVDFGSGGGLPALPLIAAWPDCSWTLVEARERRATFLNRAVRALGALDRVEIWTGDAQTLPQAAHGSTDMVTARLFGPPAVVAECAAPLLAREGRLIVSEPEIDLALRRWPKEPLKNLGLVPSAHSESGRPFVVLMRDLSVEAPSPRRRARMERSPAF